MRFPSQMDPHKVMAGESYMVWIGGVKVNGVEQSSSIGIGPKVITGARSHVKRTTGNAGVQGDRAVVVTLWGAINDADWLDAPVWSGNAGATEGK